MGRRDPWRPAPCRVRRTVRETPDTTTLELDPPPGFAFQPGQFNMLYVFGVGEVPISMSGDCTRGDVLVHTVRSVGRATAAVCAMRSGDVLGVRGPFGRPWPVDALAGHDLVIVAGGLGLAPLRPLVYDVLARRAAYGEVSVLIGARTPGDLPFAREVAGWRRRRDLRVLVTVDRAREGWTGHVGVVPALLTHLAVRPDRAQAVLCGPEVMMRFALRDLYRLGFTDDRVFVSMERSMKCAIGLCGRCQFGPDFVCRDGPVFRFDRIRDRFWIREL